MSDQDDFFNPFAELGKSLQDKAPKPAAKKEQPAPVYRQAPKAARPKDADDDGAALFLDYMRGSGAVKLNNKNAVKAAAVKETQPAPAAAASAAERETNPDMKKTAPKGKNRTGAASENAAGPEAESDADNVFAKAMQGVRPIEGKGRDLSPPAPPKPVSAPGWNRESDFLQGKFEFALEYTDEFYEGHVMGLDPLVIAKLRLGQYSPESHIDLHGLNSEQAYSALLDFIRTAYNKGQRSLVVVTGRGKNSPGGEGVLRGQMQYWLTHDPLKRVVLAFCTAQPKDGGRGALYLLLRKFKKSNGKIRWDKTPTEENPIL